MNRNWCGEVKGGWKDRKGEGRGRDSEIVLEREKKDREWVSQLLLTKPLFAPKH